MSENVSRREAHTIIVAGRQRAGHPAHGRNKAISEQSGSE
jgi:hypothetical protein